MNEKIKEKTTEELDVDPLAKLGQLSYRQLIWRRFRKNRMGLIAGIIAAAAAAVAIPLVLRQRRRRERLAKLQHLKENLGKTRHHEESEE